MNVNEVKAHITSKKLLPLYMFTGEETAVQNIYINQIAKVLGCDVVRLDTFKEIFKATRQGVVGGSHVYVVRDDKEIITNEKIYSLLDAPTWKDTVILLFSGIDKRKTFYKRYKNTICEFEPLKPEILKKYIKKEIPLSDRSCDMLIEVCEGSYSQIMLEIDKMKHYRAGMDYTDDNKVYNHVLDELLDAGVIYTPARDAIFLWADEVMKRKSATRIFNLMEECFESGNTSLMMLSVLYNNIKHTLQVQACESSDIGKSTGLTAWEIKNVKPYVDIYSDGELVEAMTLIRDMEKGIKTGQIEDKITIPYLLVNMI